MFDQRRQLDDATSQLFLVAERRAEWLIGWLRLGISSTLAIVFTVAMTSATVEMTQMLKWQVIYALGTMGVYFLLGALALVIVWAGLFRAWMVWPSALGDCVFILGSTALAVGNTGLPGLYVYVFPTVWLIPIVLACGALRFNPPLQGAMAAVLGAGLVTLLFVQGITPDVTRSNEALGFLFGVPPNLMRTAMILVGAIVLMVASTRIRALLWASITEAEARGMLKRFLPEQLAQAKAQDLDELREGQQVQMAVAFVDIRGFTRMAEGMAARDLTAFLGRFRSVISARASACGGIVDKFIGDGALVVFPDDGPGAATGAVTFTETVLESMAEAMPDTKLGIGVDCGTVFAGVVGSEGRLEYTVLGDVVNVAARLEAATKDTGMRALISETVWQAARPARRDWEPLSELRLPGRDMPVACRGLPRIEARAVAE